MLSIQLITLLYANLFFPQIQLILDTYEAKQKLFLLLL